MARHNELGKRGEVLARAFLEDGGLEILECNWRTGRAEIDLIAREGEVLVFVEVKTRRSGRHGPPDGAVDRRKARRLLSAASTYMARTGHEGEVRFDVIAVILPPGQAPQIKHIPDAFFR